MHTLKAAYARIPAFLNRNDARTILPLYALWFIIINLFALFAFNRFNFKTDTAYSWIKASGTWSVHGWDLADLHARWDSAWYLRIAENGYTYERGEPSDVVFFPLYPASIRAASLLTGGDAIVAGWLVSSIALLFALFLLFKLVEQFHPNVDPRRVLFYLLIFPTAFFLNAVYTESLFLLLSVGAFYYALKQRWLPAGAFGLLASSTRVTGILLLVPLAWEYLAANRFRAFSIFSREFLPLLMVPAGTLGFMTFHCLRYGDFLLFFHNEALWGRTFNLNTNHFQLLTEPSVVNFVQDALFVSLVLVITVYVFKQLRVSYGLYMGLTIGAALSSGTLQSIGRYALVLFPIYILLARISNRNFRMAWILASILLLAVDITSFVNFYWAG